MKKHSDSIYDQFVNALEARGLRKTQERFSILREALQMEIPFQIDFLRKQLLSKKYYVSRSTLYNTLKLMVEMGLIYKYFDNGKCYYELQNTNKNCYVIVNQHEKKEINLDTELEELIISQVEKNFNVSIKGMKITFFEN